MTKTSFNHQN